ncbi:MAG: esterase/lipase [Arcticibacterium sp.]|jgi:esterase/lipase
MNQNIKKPSFLLHITEIFRAIFQAIKAWLFIRTCSYHNIGKGQVVLIVPGLMGTDLSTKMLRSFLNKMGYRTFGWGMGRNKGRFGDLPKLVEKIKNLHEGSGQKIILIGWSMGGIFAREVSKQIPEAVKHLITMGSPFGNIHAPNNAKWVFDLLNPEREEMPEFENQIYQSANVPTLAIYSKSDGIVPWEACMEPVEDDLHHNKELKSSHFGMGTNKEVFEAVLERLKGLKK